MLPEPVFQFPHVLGQADSRYILPRAPCPETLCEFPVPLGVFPGPCGHCIESLAAEAFVSVFAQQTKGDEKRGLADVFRRGGVRVVRLPNFFPDEVGGMLPQDPFEPSLEPAADASGVAVTRSFLRLVLPAALPVGSRGWSRLPNPATCGRVPRTSGMWRSQDGLPACLAISASRAAPSPRATFGIRSIARRRSHHRLASSSPIRLRTGLQVPAHCRCLSSSPNSHSTISPASACFCGPSGSDFIVVHFSSNPNSAARRSYSFLASSILRRCSSWWSGHATSSTRRFLPQVRPLARPVSA